MPYSATQVANSFLSIAQANGEQLTNMQLQKLVYFAHGWHLALTETPLIAEPVEAWPYGPVFSNLYGKLRQYGNGTVTQPLPGGTIPAGGEKNLLEHVWQLYGHLSGPQMSFLTHKSNTPWDLCWKEQPFSTIPPALIREHFKELMKGPANG